MPAWPASLSSQLEVGASLDRQRGFLRSRTDVGPFKQRKRFTAVSRFYSGTSLVNKAQKAAFETFYVTTVNEGADEFDFEDPDDFGTVQARFTDAPQFQGLVGGEGGVAQWRATFSLELLP